MNTHAIRKPVMLVTALAFVLLGARMVFADEPGPKYTPTPRYRESPSPSPSVSPSPSPSVSPSARPVVSVYPSVSPVIGGSQTEPPGPPWKWLGIAIFLLLLLFLLILILRRRRKPTGYTPGPSQPGSGSYPPVDQKGPDQYRS